MHLDERRKNCKRKTRCRQAAKTTVRHTLPAFGKGPERRIIILTESDMLEVCSKEKASGRIPLQIEFVLADLPEGMREKLTQARKNASKEVSPKSGE